MILGRGQGGECILRPYPRGRREIITLPHPSPRSLNSIPVPIPVRGGESCSSSGSGHIGIPPAIKIYINIHSQN